jgi:hypothetical protein
MPNIISFAIHYDAGQYRSLIFRQFYRNVYVRLLSLLGIFSFFIALLYLMGVNPVQFEVFPLFALLYGLITLAIPLLLWWKTGQGFSNNPIFKEALQFSISEEGLTISSTLINKELPWTQVSRVVFIQGNPVIYTSSAAFFYIPMAQLSTEQAVFLEQQIRSKVNLVK